MRGTGKDSHRLPDPTDSGSVGMLDEGLVYYIGGKLFRLSEIARAADDLARDVAACTMPVWSGPSASWIEGGVSGIRARILIAERDELDQSVRPRRRRPRHQPARERQHPSGLGELPPSRNRPARFG